MGGVVIADAKDIKHVRIELKQDIVTGNITGKKEYEVKGKGYKFNDNEGMAGPTSKVETGEGEEIKAEKAPDVCIKTKYIKI